jgi:hypothetical protein
LNIRRCNLWCKDVPFYCNSHNGHIVLGWDTVVIGTNSDLHVEKKTLSKQELILDII